MKNLLLVFLLTPLFAFSQQQNGLSGHQESAFHRYKDFLKKDETGCSMFYGHIQLQYAFPDKISNVVFADEFSAGINMARFFTKRVHLGIFGVFETRGLFGLLFPCSFNPAFGAAINKNANLTNLSHDDSTKTAYFLNQCTSSGSVGGCGRYLYGFSFYLPYRFFPMIRVYTGLENVLVNNSGLSSSQQYEDWLNLNFDVKGVSISFFYPVEKDKITGGNISLSFFYEEEEFGNATIDGINLKSFINPAFFNTYGSVYRYGIKLGIELF